MPLDFKKYAMKGNEFLNRLARKLGDENDSDRAARVLRSVLRSLRNHITVEESVQLMAQLPMAIKRVYADGRRIHQPRKRVRTMEEFANEVLHDEGSAARRDFSSVDDVIQSIRAVIETMAPRRLLMKSMRPLAPFPSIYGTVLQRIFKVQRNIMAEQ